MTTLTLQWRRLAIPTPELSVEALPEPPDMDTFVVLRPKVFTVVRSLPEL
jgi:hypothetical protein